MKKRQFTEEQIALALPQAERTSVEDIKRHLGVSQATFIDGKARMGDCYLLK